MSDEQTVLAAVAGLKGPKAREQGLQLLREGLQQWPRSALLRNRCIRILLELGDEASLRTASQELCILKLQSRP